MTQHWKPITQQLVALFWPLTRAKLHRLNTWAGVAIAGVGAILVLAGELGIQSTEGRVAAVLAILSMLKAGWPKAQKRISAAIDGLPIPEGAQPDAPQPGDQEPVTKPEKVK